MLVPGTSQGAKISWETDQVSLSADAFSVETNDRVFTTEGAPFGVHSDPGGPDYWTLEVTWFEQDREQRLNMYFASDGADWWVDEIRTYDGSEQGEWIYYGRGPFFRTPIGEAYEGDVRLEGMGGRPDDPEVRVPGTLSIEGMRLGVSPRAPEDVAALPPDGGIAAARDPSHRADRCTAATS